MSVLPERAARAGATIIQRVSSDQITPQSCDRVLVDAPCSGSGSWRRDPAGKWRLTPQRLDALKDAQRDALAKASSAVKPGGFIVYATCSVLGIENEEQVAKFLQYRSDFHMKSARAYWPHRDQADGFYGALLQRSKV
jgi:16S rRNA (cytosine967-C5)-methyltransferase